MYSLLRSQQPEKPKDSSLPKTGLIFLFLLFLGFNFYYFFYHTAEDAAEEKAIDIDAADNLPIEFWFKLNFS